MLTKLRNGSSKLLADRSPEFFEQKFDHTEPSEMSKPGFILVLLDSFRKKKNSINGQHLFVI